MLVYYWTDSTPLITIQKDTPYFDCSVLSVVITRLSLP